MYTYSVDIQALNRKAKQRKAAVGALVFLVFLVAVGFGRLRHNLQKEAGMLEEQNARAEIVAASPQESKVVLAEQNHVPIELDIPPTPTPVKPPPPPPPSMEVMKKKGCIADGLLTEYGEDSERLIQMINESECQYLHRSIETWLEAPNFEHVKEYKDQITKPDMIYGMFIAEAIDRKDDYYYPDEQRKFDFDKMCREGTKNDWGEHTCKPSFEKEEYRKYIRHITRQAMDMGVQSFMFGQIYYQEEDMANPAAPEIIAEMRAYADSLGMKIVIGAQTNDITDEKYLRLFDYIEGGVGIDGEGNVESGPCFSRWYQKPGDWCWGLLWHPQFSSKANNVFLHLDWSGRKGDDMATFALMDKETRESTLEKLHKKFTSQNHGFLVPFLAVLPKDNGGCYGPKKGFYAPDKKYKCKDEDAINAILKGSAK